MPRQRRRRGGGEQVVADVGEQPHDRVQVVRTTGERPLAPLEDVAPQADQRRDDPVDVDLHGEHGHRGRRARPPARGAPTCGPGRRARSPGRPRRPARARSSWPVRSPMVLRLRPSAEVSCERGVGPSRCTRVSTALMLLRRSSSCETPVRGTAARARRLPCTAPRPPGSGVAPSEVSMGSECARGSGPSSADRVDAGRQQQHEPGDDVDPARRLVEQLHAVLDDRDHEPAEQRVEDPALAAVQAGAADDRRADGEQQRQRAAGRGRDGVGAAGQQDAGDRGHRGADDEAGRASSGPR